MSALHRPKTAMVLGAGLGLRMRPLTADRPKPLVALANRPMIDHVLDRLGEAGVDTAVVNVHYRAEMLEAHLQKRRRPRVIISDERGQLLDTGGGVKKALPHLGREPFFVHNSDSVTDGGLGDNLARLAALFDAGAMDCLLLLASAATSIGYTGRGDFAMDPNGRLRRRKELEIVPFVFSGISLMQPRLFDGTPDGPFSLNLAFDKAITAGRLHGMRQDGTWMHLGDVEALEQAERCIEIGDRYF